MPDVTVTIRVVTVADFRWALFTGIALLILGGGAYFLSRRQERRRPQ